MELKPCPFCGGKAELSDASQRHYYCVRCEKCWAKSAYVEYENIKNATENWNKRTQ